MRFNDRACALMDIPDLPNGAFEHIGDRKIKPQGGGGGGIPIVSDVADAVSSVIGTDGSGGGILGAVEDVGQAIGSAGAAFEKEVVNPLGGWEVVAPVTAAVLAPYAIGALGGTAGAASGAAAADAAFVAADAASLAAQGLSEAAIAQNLTAAGVSSIAAADAAALAASGIGEAAIAQNLAASYGTSTFAPTVSAATGGAPIVDYSTEATLTPGGNVVPATTLPSEMAAIDAQIAAAGKEAAAALPMKISPFQAIQGARLGMGLLAGGQQQPQQQGMPQMTPRNTMPQGAVDYSGLYNLLALQRASNPNSLLG